MGRSWANFLSMAPMGLQCLIVLSGMYLITGGEDGLKVTLDLMDESYSRLHRLFLLLTGGRDRPLTAELWAGASLGVHFDKSFEAAGGPFHSVESFRNFVDSQ